MNVDLNVKVWIHAMGSYYSGLVVAHGKASIVRHDCQSGAIVGKQPARVQVRYTSGAGKSRDKWVNYDLASQTYRAPHETFPLVAGDLPQPAGARALQARR